MTTETIQSNVTLNSSFSSSLIGETTAGVITGEYNLNQYWYPDWYYPTVREYYPVYYGYWQSNQDKHQQAFNVARMLVDKKIVELKKVKDFIELVENIFKVM